ncbi:hypothetical protein JXM67_02630 [candidate division WOR-3 bacterium]|nr:hypothetical protein [candidate division WOR-3 bacterium]
MRKWFWPWALATSLVLLSTGCSRKPPLVLSVQLPSYYSDFSGTSDNFYFMLTDSLLCITEYVPKNNSMGRIILRRIELEAPHKADTIIYTDKPLLNVYNRAYVPHGNKLNINEWHDWCFTPPKPGYVLYPLPLGDTSAMLHFGHLDGLYCDTFTRERFERDLHSSGQYFYLVDMSSASPRTVASFEGLVLDYYYPYLLLYTGFKYLEWGVNIFQDNMGGNDVRFMVINLEKMNTVLDLPDREGTVMLTPDGRLILVDTLSMPDPKRDSIVFMTERHNVLEINLRTGERTEKTVRVPRYALGLHDTYPFIAPDGKVWFVGSKNSWGMEIDRSFEVPPLSDFSDSIYSALWFRRLLGDEENWLDWRLSPQGRWLVLDYYKGYESIFSRYSRILSSRALCDPSGLDSVGKLRRFPCGWLMRRLFRASFEFLPGEEWVLIRFEPKNWAAMFLSWIVVGTTPKLYRCGGEARPVALGARYNITDPFLTEVFFSPNGRYVGYTSSAGSRPYIKVRRLPD